MKLSIQFAENIQTSAIIMILLTVMNLSGIVNISVVVIFIYCIITIPYHPPKFYALQLAGQLKKYLVQDLHRIHGMISKQQNKGIDQLLAVKFVRSRVLCIHLLVLKNQELEKLYLTQIVKTVHTVTLGMMSIMPLNINYTNGVLIGCFIIHMK